MGKFQASVWFSSEKDVVWDNPQIVRGKCNVKDRKQLAQRDL